MGGNPKPFKFFLTNSRLQVILPEYQDCKDVPGDAQDADQRDGETLQEEGHDQSYVGVPALITAVRHLIKICLVGPSLAYFFITKKSNCLYITNSEAMPDLL